jgi:plastocyanin
MFDNKEVDVSHNVEILDHPGGTSLFTGEIISGPKTITYKLKAFEAGTYYFRCSVHPLRMNGTLLVSP